jgi:hypothetical protein
MERDEQHTSDEGLPLEPTEIVRRTRPKALWAVLAAVAVAAGAVAVNAGRDSGSAPGLPVALGAGGAMASESASADSSMLAWVTYVAAEGLPTLGGEAGAYRLAGAVSEDQVVALAEALGVEGSADRHEGGWSVRGATGTLEVADGFGGQWSFFGASGDVAVAGPTQSSGGGSSGCDPVGDTACTPTTFVEPEVEPCTASDGPAECVTGECPPGEPCAIEGDEGVDGGCTPEECVVDPVPLPRPIDPPPAADLPSQDEARAIALDLLARAGTAVDGAGVTVDGPYDAWYVTVEPLVDGFRSGLLASASVGPEGVVTSANGFFATPERVGTYPILDTRAAIDRANAATGGLSGGTGDDVGIGTSGTTGVASEDDVVTCDALIPECGYEGPSDGGVVHTCATQPDGREVCEVVACPSPTTVPGEAPPELCPPVGDLDLCPQVAAEEGTTGGAEPGASDTTGSTDAAVEAPAPAAPGCTPPVPGETVPEPAPDPGLPPAGGAIEVVLVDAEPSLVLLGALDGSADAYLVPAYRFTAEDGTTVDLPAVADEALTGAGQPDPGTPDTTDTSATPPPPDTVEPNPKPTEPCEVLVEGDASSTTHTLQPAPGCAPQGTVELGVAYDVRVISHCGHIADHDGRWWSTVEVVTDLGADAGTLTLESRDLGVFEGNGLTADFEARGPAEDYPGCD